MNSLGCWNSVRYRSTLVRSLTSELTIIHVAPSTEFHKDNSVSSIVQAHLKFTSCCHRCRHRRWVSVPQSITVSSNRFQSLLDDILTQLPSFPLPPCHKDAPMLQRYSHVTILGHNTVPNFPRHRRRISPYVQVYTLYLHNIIFHLSKTSHHVQHLCSNVAPTA